MNQHIEQQHKEDHKTNGKKKFFVKNKIAVGNQLFKNGFHKF